MNAVELRDGTVIGPLRGQESKRSHRCGSAVSFDDLNRVLAP
jgi:hypothetical protein